MSQAFLTEKTLPKDVAKYLQENGLIPKIRLMYQARDASLESDANWPFPVLAEPIINGYGATITKEASRRYLISFNQPFANLNYCFVIGSEVRTHIIEAKRTDYMRVRFGASNADGALDPEHFSIIIYEGV